MNAPSLADSELSAPLARCFPSHESGTVCRVATRRCTTHLHQTLSSCDFSFQQPRFVSILPSLATSNSPRFPLYSSHFSIWPSVLLSRRSNSSPNTSPQQPQQTPQTTPQNHFHANLSCLPPPHHLWPTHKPTASRIRPETMTPHPP